MRRLAAASLFVLLVSAGTAGASPAETVAIRVEGKILRKASGKLVLSLTEFELKGEKEVTLLNRWTGEGRTVALASVYWDISYSDLLPDDFFGRIVEDDWTPYTTWRIPATVEALNRELGELYRHQNALRKELGNALLEEGKAETRVSSRLTLNKIEKFHRIASVIAREILKLSRDREDLNPFIYPVTVQIGFNPYGEYPPRLKVSPILQVREILYWEVNRVLTQQFGLDEDLVGLVYDAPTTTRQFLPLEKLGAAELKEFFPTVTLSAESMDGAVYLLRQGFDDELKRLIALKRFRDTFIRERPALDLFVNEGRVVGLSGRRVAVTFVPPFMKPGETVYVALDEGGLKEIPIVLSNPVEVGGYTLSEELPEKVVARIRQGMPVRRK